MELSQERLALCAEIHPTWISHIESGRINPTWGNVRRIAAGLSVTLPRLAELAEEFEGVRDSQPAVEFNSMLSIGNGVRLGLRYLRGGPAMLADDVGPLLDRPRWPHTLSRWIATSPSCAG